MTDDREPEFITMDECQVRGVYRIVSRNLRVGVYDGDEGFVGVREKFNDRYLFTEYHWDQGPPFGTVRPLELLGFLPDDIDLREREETTCAWGGCGRPAHFVENDDGSGFGKWFHDDDTLLCEEGRPGSAIHNPLLEYLEGVESALYKSQ